MPCYKPLNAYVLLKPTENGKAQIVFKKPSGTYKSDIELPCGQCIGCRQRKAVTWATRIMHEASLHETNCFITLTYNDKEIPSDYSLRHEDFQLFMRYLRRRINKKSKTCERKIRFFMCGEYGEEHWRPHFHAVIFNYDFPDKQQIQFDKVKYTTYISEELDKVWGKGFSTIQDLTFENAAYLAKYCIKKVTGEESEAHYNRVVTDWNEITGEITHYEEVQLKPEYARQSNRPGIGNEWFKEWKSDCYPSDYLVHNGRRIPIPQYYDRLLEKEDAYKMLIIKQRRKLKAITDPNNSYERLIAREKCALDKAKTSRRNKC